MKYIYKYRFFCNGSFLKSVLSWSDPVDSILMRIWLELVLITEAGGGQKKARISFINLLEKLSKSDQV